MILSGEPEHKRKEGKKDHKRVSAQRQSRLHRHVAVVLSVKPSDEGTKGDRLLWLFSNHSTMPKTSFWKTPIVLVWEDILPRMVEPVSMQFLNRESVRRHETRKVHY